MIRKTIFATLFTLSLIIGLNAVDETEVVTLKLGTKAPDFNLPCIDGKNWKLSDFDKSKFSSSSSPVSIAQPRSITMIAGKEVAVKENRVFGCSVKWSSKGEEMRKYKSKLDAEPITIEPIDAEGMRKLRQNNASNDKSKLRLINFWATW